MSSVAVVIGALRVKTMFMVKPKEYKLRFSDFLDIEAGRSKKQITDGKCYYALQLYLNKQFLV